MADLTAADQANIQRIQAGIPESMREAARQAIAAHECYIQNLRKTHPDVFRDPQMIPLLLHNNTSLPDNIRNDLRALSQAYTGGIMALSNRGQEAARELGLDTAAPVGDPPQSLASHAVVGITRTLGSVGCAHIAQATPRHSQVASTRHFSPRIST